MWTMFPSITFHREDLNLFLSTLFSFCFKQRHLEYETWRVAIHCVSSDDAPGGHADPWKLASSNHWILIDHTQKERIVTVIQDQGRTCLDQSLKRTPEHGRYWMSTETIKKTDRRKKKKDVRRWPCHGDDWEKDKITWRECQTWRRIVSETNVKDVQ